MEENIQITLDKLPLGRQATVVKLNGEYSSLRRRLLDMGLTKGTQVSIQRVAPLGDPIEIKLRNYFLTIRKSDAMLVEVI